MPAAHARRAPKNALAKTPLSRRLPLATLAPLACAVHCLATPLLVAVFPVLHAGPLVERLLLGSSIVLASWGLWQGIARHGRFVVILPVTFGLLLWGTAVSGFALAGDEMVTGLGAITTATGLFWNARLRHRVTHAAPSFSCLEEHGTD